TASSHAAPSVRSEEMNGDGAHAAVVALSHAGKAPPALPQPETRMVPLNLPQSAVAEAATESVAQLVKTVETFFVGSAGAEVRDYAFRYHSDGSIRETAVF